MRVARSVQMCAELVTQPRHGGQLQERENPTTKRHILDEQLKVRIMIIFRTHQLRLEPDVAVLVADGSHLVHAEQA
ncbi:MAG: hypothetical protein JO281_06450 [Pseudonocardiales bacterium]|nr:hypothetical protein [Pseudonocardiales bacterium]